MKKYFIAFYILCAFLTVYAQEDLSVNTYWMYNGNMTNALYEQIREYAFTQLNGRRSHVGGLTSENDWMNRQAEVKKIISETVGDFPAKTPLNPVITKIIKKLGFQQMWDTE
jgi:hypothetical protein